MLLYLSRVISTKCFFRIVNLQTWLSPHASRGQVFVPDVEEFEKHNSEQNKQMLPLETICLEKKDTPNFMEVLWAGGGRRSFQWLQPTCTASLVVGYGKGRNLWIWGNLVARHLQQPAKRKIEWGLTWNIHVGKWLVRVSLWFNSLQVQHQNGKGRNTSLPRLTQRTLFYWEKPSERELSALANLPTTEEWPLFSNNSRKLVARSVH